MAKKTAQRPSKKQIVKVDDLRIDIHSTFNNTIISGAALNTGNVLAWASSGSSGFKGTKKGTPYAATTAMKTFLEKIAPYQPTTTTAKVFVSGAGNGRDAALRALVGSGLKVLGIRDVTPLPHNGCRAKKARRV